MSSNTPKREQEQNQALLTEHSAPDTAEPSIKLDNTRVKIKSTTVKILRQRNKKKCINYKTTRKRRSFKGKDKLNKDQNQPLIHEYYGRLSPKHKKVVVGEGADGPSQVQQTLDSNLSHKDIGSK